MRLVAHNKFGAAVEQRFTEMLVYDDFDNLVAAVVQHGEQTYEIVRVGDRDFRKVLGVLGLDKLAPEFTALDARKSP